MHVVLDKCPMFADQYQNVKFYISGRRYTNMPCQCGHPDGMSTRGRMVFPRAATLAWHICFIIPNKPQLGKISMKTTMTARRYSENG